MKRLYVRIQQKQGATRFFRCGMEFTKTWKPVEVDAATAARLESEQMLEVSETEPAKLENEAPNEADPSGDSTAATGSDTSAAAPAEEIVTTTNDAVIAQAAPENPAIRLETIRAAIQLLDKENPALWTVDGKPKTEGLSAITGWPVSAAERDAALAEGEA